MSRKDYWLAHIAAVVIAVALMYLILVVLLCGSFSGFVFGAICGVGFSTWRSRKELFR